MQRTWHDRQIGRPRPPAYHSESVVSTDQSEPITSGYGETENSFKTKRAFPPVTKTPWPANVPPNVKPMLPSLDIATLNSFGTSAPPFPNTEDHWSGDTATVSVDSPSRNSA